MPSKAESPNQDDEMLFPSVLNKYLSTLNLSSQTLIVKCDPAIEMFTYHQELHARPELKQDLKLFDFLTKNLDDYLININTHIAHSLVDENGLTLFEVFV